MKKFKISKWLLALAVGVMVATGLQSPVISKAEDNEMETEALGVQSNGEIVELNEDNFPNTRFREYLAETFDLDNDNMINIADVKEITLPSGSGASTGGTFSLEGIEFFTELEKLYAGTATWMPGKKIDLSNNKALIELQLSGTGITELDLSNNPALTHLTCNNTALEVLDVSNNAALIYLCCDSNTGTIKIKNINVGNKPSLETLICNNIKITELDLSNCPALTHLECVANDLAELDLRNCPALTYLKCSSNDLTELDLSNSQALTHLDCRGNDLTELDLSNSQALTYLDCGGNNLTELDLSNSQALTYLNCENNNLTQLNLSNNVALEYLKCNNNSLTKLDLSNNDCLYSVYIGQNYLLEEIVFSTNAEIKRLGIDSTFPINLLNIPGLSRVTLYVTKSEDSINLSHIIGIENYIGDNGWDANEKVLSYRLVAGRIPSGYTTLVWSSGNVYIETDCRHRESRVSNVKVQSCTEEGYSGDKVCVDCGIILERGKLIGKNAHRYVHGKCSVCGDVQTNYEPSCTHNETEVKNAKTATCIVEGYTGDKVCKTCGEVVEAGTAIEKTTHSYVSGKCSVCGEADPDYREPDTEPTPQEPVGEWKQDSGRWWYRRADGSYPRDAWEQIEGKWYLFDASGYMLIGWQKTGGKWYYLYSDGSMAASTTIDGYVIGADGAWVENSSDGADDGAAGWKQDSTGWWYKRTDGSYPINAWEQISGEWYLFDASGYMLTGWQKVGGKWYYLYGNGVMATNTTIDGYAIGASGAWVENGWKSDATGWWYQKSDGSFPRACWELIDAVWYRFNAAGYMQTGWIDDGGTWYFAEDSGSLATGWKQIGSAWYYFYTSGAMAADTVIDGFRIGAAGEWIQ